MVGRYKNQGTVTAEFDGKTYSGNWELNRGTLTVDSFEWGSKSTQLGGMPAEALAKTLLRELLHEGRAKKLI